MLQIPLFSNHSSSLYLCFYWIYVVDGLIKSKGHATRAQFYHNIVTMPSPTMDLNDIVEDYVELGRYRCNC